jgi:MraZ protein
MFLGEYQHSVDTKGRLAVPARFRSKIERGAVLARGVDPCLYVYPLEAWEQKAHELSANITDPRMLRLVERRFFGLAYEVELDTQGRIVLPVKLRQYANLNGEAMVIGARDRFEVWSVEGWEAALAEVQEEDFSRLPLPF